MRAHFDKSLNQSLSHRNVGAASQAQCECSRRNANTLPWLLIKSLVNPQKFIDLPSKMAEALDWNAYDSQEEILNPDSCYRQKPYQKAPSKTRKPMKPNVFNYFVKIQMPDFKKNNAELKHNDVMKQLGATWKALPESQKTEYEFHFKKSPPFLSTIFYQVEDQNGCRNSLLELPSPIFYRVRSSCIHSRDTRRK